ncbi:MAG: hypothetical protein JSS30_04605 [Verrucomicrobia bacterium]|nr:hypothetical protein [Verrucomicrobiota bacterium]
MKITPLAYQIIKQEWHRPIPSEYEVVRIGASALHKTMVAIAALVVVVATPLLALIDLCCLPWNQERSVGKLSILDFYQGGQNDRGVTLEEIWNYSDDQLEAHHDFIQWLFPLKKQSRYNPSAAITDDAVIAAFRQDKSLQDKMVHSLDVMLRFYGLEWGGDKIVIGSHFGKQTQWLTPGNHNFLRVTRILTSLKLHGLEKQAKALMGGLEEVYRLYPKQIGPKTFSIWKRAVLEG